MDYENQIHNELLNLIPGYLLQMQSDRVIKNYFKMNQGGIDNYIEYDTFAITIQTKTGKIINYDQLTYFKTAIDQIHLNKPIYKFFLSQKAKITKGQKTYLNDNNIIFVQTVQEIYQFLKQNNIIQNPIIKTVILRDYQEETINNFKESFKQGNQQFLIQLPTGTGKTIIAINICEWVYGITKNPILWITEKKDILQSQQNKFSTTLQKGNFTNQDNFDENILFSTTDMFLRHYEKLLNKISMIVIDECHNAGAPETQRILKIFKPITMLLGLSATPKRNNSNYIQNLFDTNFIMKMSLPESIDKDIIVKPKFYNHYTTKYQNTFEDTKFIELIQRGFENSKLKKGLAWCSTKEQANQWYNYFKQNPLKDIDIYITHTDIKNNDIQKFQNTNQNALMICVYRCREGYDDEYVDIIIDLEPVQKKSDSMLIQQIGRGARKNQNKELVHVIRPIPVQKDQDSVNRISKSLLELSLYYGLENTITIKEGKISIGSTGDSKQVFEIDFNTDIETINYDQIKDKIRELMQLEQSYNEIKKIVHSYQFKTKEEYQQQTLNDVTLPFYPQERFQKEFEGWFKYLGIKQDFYDYKTAYERIKELNIKTENINNIVPTLKKLTEIDEGFPPWDLWQEQYQCDIFKILNIKKIL